MENLKIKLDREYDLMLQNFHRELEKLHQSHQQDLEKRVGEVFLNVALNFGSILAWFFLDKI